MYDSIIIGKDLSSLIAALTAARRGLKIILVSGSSSDADHRAEGYSFPIDPTPLSGFGQGQIVKRLLDDLGISIDHSPPLLLMNPAFQVVLPDHRVDFYHDRNRLIRDLVREFPQNESEIIQFYEAVFRACLRVERWLDEDSSGNPNRFQKLSKTILRFFTALVSRTSLAIRGDGDIGSLRKIIESQISIFSHLDVLKSTFPLSAAYLLSLPVRGIFYPPGGRTNWQNWLRKEFIDAGGVLMDRGTVIRIETKPRIIVDLEDADGPKTLRGKKLIISTQWEDLHLLLFHQKVFRRTVRRLGYISPNRYQFSLHMGVHEECFPEQMTPYTLLIPDEAKSLDGQNLVFIECSLPHDKDRAPEGRRALTATVFLKESPMVIEDLSLNRIAKSIIDSLEGFLPFLRENIDYMNIEKSIAIARRCQETVSQKYRIPRNSITGLHTTSPHTSLPNIFLTGGMFHAGLGFEGEILSGIDAASWAGKDGGDHGQ